MQEKKIKFAIIGQGHIGRRHAAMVMGHDESELVAVVDPIKELVDEQARLNGVKGFYSIDDLIASGIEVDVMNICTPNGLHASLAIKALEARANVVIEKPMGLTRQECEDVIFKSLQVSRQVFIVKQNRYTPTSAWLKEVISGGKLGKINMVQLNCYWNRDDRYYKKGGWKGKLDLDGGVLFTQFSHFIDIMYWLFGDIKNVQTRTTNFNHKHNTEFDDSGIISFEFVNGGIGSLNFSTSIWDQNMESSIAVIGENGAVKVAGQYMDTVEYVHIKDYTMPQLPPSAPPNDYGDYKGSAANHHFVIQNVIDVLMNRAVISTNALEGLKVVEIIERMNGKKME